MIEYELVVVGGGIAGLRAAIAAAEADLRVAVISRTNPIAHHDANLREGFNAPDGDRLKNAFVADCVAAGCGLADPSAIATVSDRAVGEAIAVEHMGATFARSTDGGLDAFRLAGNSAAYSLQAGWWSGRAVQNALIDQAAAYAIDIFSEWLALEVVADDAGVCGLTALNIRSGQVQAFSTGNVLLTEGSVGGIYTTSGNPRCCIGGGQALAAAVGAPLVDMEFVEYCAGLNSTSPSINGTLIGDAAAVAVAAYTGLRSQPDPVTPGGLARALDPGGSTRIDFSGNREEIELFAGEIGLLLGPELSAGVIPSVAYCLGGIAPDTGIDGLWAAGEAAVSPLLGAGLLAGNALLDLVQSATAAVMQITPRPGRVPASLRQKAQDEIQLTFSGDLQIDTAVLWDRLRAAMTQSAGLARDRDGLERARGQIDEIVALAARCAPAFPGAHFNLELVRLLELRQGLVSAAAIVAGSSARLESRGPHQRVDFPGQSANFGDHTVLRLGDAGFNVQRELRIGRSPAGVAR